MEVVILRPGVVLIRGGRLTVQVEGTRPASMGVGVPVHECAVVKASHRTVVPAVRVMHVMVMVEMRMMVVMVMVMPVVMMMSAVVVMMVMVVVMVVMVAVVMMMVMVAAVVAFRQCPIGRKAQKRSGQGYTAEPA
jgi:hypothetical protein